MHQPYIVHSAELCSVQHAPTPQVAALQAVGDAHPEVMLACVTVVRSMRKLQEDHFFYTEDLVNRTVPGNLRKSGFARTTA